MFRSGILTTDKQTPGHLQQVPRIVARVATAVSVALWLLIGSGIFISAQASSIVYEAPSGFHMLFDDGNDMTLTGTFTVDLPVTPQGLSGAITLIGTGSEAGLYNADRTIGTETAVFISATAFLTFYFVSDFGNSPLQSEVVSFLPFDGLPVHTSDDLPAFTATVPETPTWAMLLIGFAGMGFLVYRRNSKQAPMAA